ncbi:TilS substrate-binding domain-containing protein [Serratia ureilytica]
MRRFALLRRWIALFNVTMPAREQLQRLWEEVALSREDAEPQLQLGAYQIRRFRGRLHLLPPLAALRDVHLPGCLTSRWRCRTGWGGLSRVRVSLRCARRSRRSGSAFVSAACRARCASWGAPIRGR